MKFSDVPPPPPRVEIMPKVDYIRGYSQEHGRYFYIKLDHADPIDPSHGQSQWEAPTEGIVQCRLSFLQNTLANFL